MKTKSTPPDTTSTLISELEELIKRGNAHAPFERAVKDVDPKLLGTVPKGSAYSIWQLVEHLRITQWDILEFSRDPHHKSPKWPDEYWPKDPAPPDAAAWKKTLDQIAADKKSFIELLHKNAEGLFTVFPYGDGQSLFREALVLADHNSYHIAEIVLTRRILGNWG